jgi:hypothetical protein
MYNGRQEQVDRVGVARKRVAVGTVPPAALAMRSNVVKSCIQHNRDHARFANRNDHLLPRCFSSAARSWAARTATIVIG